MFTLNFWRDTAERAVKTAAQSLGGALAGYAATGFSWTGALIAGGVAAALSVLTSLASAPVGTKGTASLVSEPGGRHRRTE
ncbi:holin [Nocardia phage NS-I]|nr:holin [Nocardia phage NS-I]